METTLTSGRFGRRVAAERLLIALFVIALLLPGLGLLTPIPIARARPPAERPIAAPVLRLNQKSLLAYPAAFYQYFTRNFAFRALLVRTHSLVKVRWLRVSPTEDVMIGSDGWLYYGGEGELDCARHTRPFPTPMLRRWQTILEGRRDWLAKRHIKFLVVICPDKHTIYPEHLPLAAHPVAEPSRLDQLMEHMRAHSDVTMLDLRPALLKAKSRYPVYHRLDTHWSATGAFVAHQEILRKLQAWYPQTPIPELAEYRVKVRPALQHDLADLLGFSEGELSENVLGIAPKHQHTWKVVGGDRKRLEMGNIVTDFAVSEKRGAPIPRVVMLRDSFSMALVPFLSEQFGYAAYVWSDIFDLNLLEREHPDVVIWELVERRLMKPTPWM